MAALQSLQYGAGVLLLVGGLHRQGVCPGRVDLERPLCRNVLTRWQSINLNGEVRLGSEHGGDAPGERVA